MRVCTTINGMADDPRATDRRRRKRERDMAEAEKAERSAPDNATVEGAKTNESPKKDKTITRASMTKRRSKK